MEKHLYPLFNHWYRGGSIYFYSDPHFEDEEMKFLRANYIGDEEQVKRINSKVGKNDTIIFLGDIGNLNWIKKVRGYKVLIKGNHDVGATKYREYFDEVYEGGLWIAEKIVISHEPIDLSFALNIHGHDHSNWFKGENCLNVCAEHINYTPISLNEIIKSGRLKNIPSIHRLAIDKQIERKGLKE